MATRVHLALKVTLLERIAALDTKKELSDAAKRARALLEDFDKANAGNQPAEADRIAKEILELVQDGQALQPASKSDTSWPRAGIAALAIVFIAVTVFLAYYVYSLGAAGLSTIEGTRPLLVVTAIISTIAFGGALLLGSLFSAEGSVEDRFRRAREVFLVFSGIFGTVVGFYFGAGESKGPPLSV